MTPKLYMTEICPSVRAVLLTARILNVTLELKQVDIGKLEHLSPKFLKLNPQHTVPTLEDSGFVIWDSHAIIAYLVGKYATDDSLYPKDVQKRALIDQRLHFDSSICSTFTRNILNPLLHNTSEIDAENNRECITKTYKLLEHFLDEGDWIAGDSVTIADLSLLPSITSLNLVIPIDEIQCPKVMNWIRRAENLHWYVGNENGLNKLRSLLNSKCCSCCG